MQETRIFPVRWYTPLLVPFFRLASAGLVPANWFAASVPGEDGRRAFTGHLKLEIVSHCWRYAAMAVYQLSSLVNYPPTKLSVTLTLFYSVEDAGTVELLRFFEGQKVSNVTWNWQPLLKERLFRREIGRNMAALSTEAHWVWFTDCDILFHRGCLDTLADELQGRREILLYPRHERTTDMLDDSDPMLLESRSGFRVVDIEADRFALHARDRAKGAFQMVHGDVARACGYCNGLPGLQTPSDRWRKCHGDTVFRWLMRTRGVPIEIPGVYQIRHKTKGRYGKPGVLGRIRSGIRQIQNRSRERAGP